MIALADRPPGFLLLRSERTHLVRPGSWPPILDTLCGLTSLKLSPPEVRLLDAADVITDPCLDCTRIVNWAPTHGDRYGFERRRRLFHVIPAEQTGPPFASRCGRSFPVSPDALASTLGDGVEVCLQCLRAIVRRGPSVRKRSA